MDLKIDNDDPLNKSWSIKLEKSDFSLWQGKYRVLFKFRRKVVKLEINYKSLTKIVNKDTCSTKYKLLFITNNDETIFECNYLDLD
jgi:hypothetical protein